MREGPLSSRDKGKTIKNMEANCSQDLGVATNIIMNYITREAIKEYGNGSEQVEDGSSSDDYDSVEDEPFKYNPKDSLEHDDSLYDGYIEAIFDEEDSSCASKRRK